jgi:hypothetical protein
MRSIFAVDVAGQLLKEMGTNPESVKSHKVFPMIKKRYTCYSPPAAGKGYLKKRREKCAEAQKDPKFAFAEQWISAGAAGQQRN